MAIQKVDTYICKPLWLYISNSIDRDFSHLFHNKVTILILGLLRYFIDGFNFSRLLLYIPCTQFSLQIETCSNVFHGIKLAAVPDSTFIRHYILFPLHDTEIFVKSETDP